MNSENPLFEDTTSELDISKWKTGIQLQRDLENIRQNPSTIKQIELLDEFIQKCETTKNKYMSLYTHRENKLDPSFNKMLQTKEQMKKHNQFKDQHITKKHPKDGSEYEEITDITLMLQPIEKLIFNKSIRENTVMPPSLCERVSVQFLPTKIIKERISYWDGIVRENILSTYIKTDDTYEVEKDNDAPIMYESMSILKSKIRSIMNPKEEAKKMKQTILASSQYQEEIDKNTRLKSFGIFWQRLDEKLQELEETTITFHSITIPEIQSALGKKISELQTEIQTFVQEQLKKLQKEQQNSIISSIELEEITNEIHKIKKHPDLQRYNVTEN